MAGVDQSQKQVATGRATVASNLGSTSEVSPISQKGAIEGAQSKAEFLAQMNQVTKVFRGALLQLSADVSNVASVKDTLTLRDSDFPKV